MSSSPASPTIDGVLPGIAAAFVLDIVTSTAQSVLYGTYLIVFPVAFRSLLKRRDERRWLALTAATTLFVFSSFIWAANIAALVQRLNVIFGATERPVLSRLFLADSSVMRITHAVNVLFVFSYMIGDALIAWRILVLCQWGRWRSVALIGLWLGTSAMGLGFFGCVAHAGFPTDHGLPRLCNKLGRSAWVSSLAFNGLATTLLAHNALSRRKVSIILGPKRTPNAHRVLLMLVCCGVIYSILGVLRSTVSRFTYTWQITEGMLTQLVGLYPTVVTTLLCENEILRQSSTFRNATRIGTSRISDDTDDVPLLGDQDLRTI